VDIAAWLHRLGLERYEQAFRDNAVDGEVLPSLTAEDLKDLGVTAVGDRRRLLDAIASLRAAAKPDQAPARQPGTAEEPAGERRQVVVLFADLAGYTALSRELDAEDVHALLGRFFGRVDRVVEEHGGRVDKHLGDCVMAVFGAPLAYGNEAERAVHAALAVRDAIMTRSGRLEPGDAVVLAAHDDRRDGDPLGVHHQQVGAHVDVGAVRHRVVQRQDGVGERLDRRVVGRPGMVAGESRADEGPVDRPPARGPKLRELRAALGQRRAALAGPGERVQRQPLDPVRVPCREHGGAQGAPELMP
jgi:class 3 adenylate cyclase